VVTNSHFSFLKNQFTMYVTAPPIEKTDVASVVVAATQIYDGFVDRVRCQRNF
jgi:hypothetical protein